MSEMSISPDLYEFLATYTAPVKKLERELVGRKNEMRSLMAGMMRPELCNIILLAEAGSGKALVNGTEIPFYMGASGEHGGYCKIEDLREGDLVFDKDGKPVRVAGVFPQGRKRAYRVVFSDGTSLICNDEHLWTARNQYRHYANKPYRTYTLRQMLEDGLYMPNGSCRWYIPISKAVERPAARLPVRPYLIGAVLGGGVIGLDGVVRFFVNDADVSNLIGSMMGLGDVKVVQTDKGTQFVPVCEGSAPVMWDDLFSRPDLNDLLRLPRIPPMYLTGSKDQRWELMRGLMDLGGRVFSTYRGNCVFVTQSAGLADDVRELAASLGVRAESWLDGIEHHVRFIADDEVKRALFSSVQKLSKLMKYQNKTAGKKAALPVTDLCIERVDDLGYDVDMTCIYVDSPSHLFLAGREHIVTHNTALVQGTMMQDKKRLYLEVDLAKMISNLKDPNEMAAKLKTLFYETGRYVENEGREIVLFIDEFHQIVQLSDAAVEALKPLLADSGTRGIRVIAATTYVEFQQFISPNQPLVERLQRINLVQPDKDMTVAILRGMAERYGVSDQFPDDNIYELIYEYTNRYVPASSQPRKSLTTLDAMIGWHRSEGRPMDQKLLADVIHESQGVNVAFRVDAASIKQRLDQRVLSQQLATTMLEQRLQICVADLNDKSRPMSSFLFCGSTGTGKEVADSEPVAVYLPDGSLYYKNHGDLEVGDYVFDREGRPTKVTGVFPQGVKDSYAVEFADGRCVRVGAGHLWTYRARRAANPDAWKVADTLDLMGLLEAHPGTTYVIPMNGAVEWPAARHKIDSYAMGVFVARGRLTATAISVSTRDEFVLEKTCRLIGASGYAKMGSRNSWTFGLPSDPAAAKEMRKSKTHSNCATAAVLSECPQLVGCHLSDRFIPVSYKYGSVEQRWSLIRGLFDANGSAVIHKNGYCYVLYGSTSELLIRDISDVLHSLGVSNTVYACSKSEYRVYVRSAGHDLRRFFSLPRKLAVIESAGRVVDKKESGVLGIRSIKKLDFTEPMTCIMVDNDEHIYQVGQHVCTHNTEMTKSLAEILFEDSKNLIRIDCTEYANADSLERFRRELTARVWERPYSIVLLDEIEKACSPVTRILLQVLDDGRLSDANGRQVSFVNAYFVLTTNAGSEIFRTIGQYNADDTGSGIKLKRYDKLIRSSISDTTGENRFPPELLGRIDCIVPFQPLSENTMKAIAKMKLTRLKDDVMKKHGVTVRFHPTVVRYLVEDNLDTDSNSGGARILASKLESEVTTVLARYINEHPNEKMLQVVIEGKMASDNEDMLESKAYVVVTPGMGR